MALVIYPTEDYDSLISEADATDWINKNSVNASLWLAKTTEEKEVYLRIATTRILDVVALDDTYDQVTSCLPSVCANMAIYDIAFNISTNINNNEGLITREKVGDLEVEYQHNRNTNKKGIKTSPYPKEVKTCLSSYGAIFSVSGIAQITLERK